MKNITLVLTAILLPLFAKGGEYSAETPELDKLEYRFTHVDYYTTCIPTGRFYADNNQRQVNFHKCRKIAKDRAEAMSAPILFVDGTNGDERMGTKRLVWGDTRFLRGNPTHLIINMHSSTSATAENMFALADKLQKLGVKLLLYSYFHPIPEFLKNHPIVEVLEDGSGSFTTLTDKKGRAMKAQILHTNIQSIGIKRLSDGKEFRIRPYWLSTETYDRLFNVMKDPFAIAQIESGNQGIRCSYPCIMNNYTTNPY
jgi:hypothetical protein